MCIPLTLSLCYCLKRGKAYHYSLSRLSSTSMNYCVLYFPLTRPASTTMYHYPSSPLPRVYCGEILGVLLAPLTPSITCPNAKINPPFFPSLFRFLSSSLHFHSPSSTHTVLTYSPLDSPAPPPHSTSFTLDDPSDTRYEP